jgi:ribosomal protein L16/L10AE
LAINIAARQSARMQNNKYFAKQNKMQIKVFLCEIEEKCN